MNSPSPAQNPRRVPCPTCQRQALYDPGNRWRPFCSERCRSADLGAWASEQFRVAADTAPDAPSPETPH